MTEQESGKQIPSDDPVAVELLMAVRTGDVAAVQGSILGSTPRPADVSQAFWHACTGGQRRAAEYLLSRGADLNWEPEYAHGMPLDAASGLSTRQENVVSWLRELGARSASSD